MHGPSYILQTIQPAQPWLAPDLSYESLYWLSRSLPQALPSLCHSTSIPNLILAYVP